LSEAAGGAPKRPRGVDFASIERELTALWQQGEGEGERPLATRACMSNLLVSCATAREGDAIAAEIEPIVQQHPSRVLILVAEGSGQGGDVDAVVSATCYAGDGGRKVCAETVTLYAESDPARRLPATVRPLVIGDLPTSLWWTGDEPAVLAGDLFRELVSMSQQLIIDSSRWRDPGPGLAATARWALGSSAGTGLSDLAWTRTFPWRSALGQALDSQSVPGALRSISRVRIEHASNGTTQALLMTGWLAARLEWQAQAVRSDRGRVEAKHRGGTSDPVVEIVRRDAGEGLASLTVGWDAGDEPRELTLQRIGNERLSVTRGQGEPHHVRPLLERGRAWLVARELADLGRDRVFRQALEASRRLVESSGS
jgi:glucose-6-phosphate dehydrogenase assembly protein OpcA